MNEEEYKKDLEKRRKKASKEYFKSVEELRKDKKKFIIKIIIIFTIFIITFKLIIKELLIPIPFVEYPKNRQYELYLNDVHYDAEVIDNHKITIIPYFIYLVDSHHTVYIGEPNVSDRISSDTKEYKIKIESYSCYAKNLSKKYMKVQTSCNSLNEDLIRVKNNDTKYEMTITKDSYTTIYKGIFKDDITEYINDKGFYHIEIVGKYKNVESTIYFSFYLI